jgi:hypothetical protein
MAEATSAGVHRARAALTEDEIWLLDRCTAIVDEVSSVTHLSVVADGDWRFSVDRGESAERVNRTRIVAQGVVSRFLDLHDRLQPARTGALIRLVLETPRGALLVYALPSRTHLIGFSLRGPEHTVDAAANGSAPETQQADRALAAAADQARSASALSSQNPGGWRSGASAEPPAAIGTEPVVTGIVDERVLPLCRDSVDQNLQYVLYLGAGEHVFALDHFDGLAPLLPGDTSAALLRRVYRGLEEYLDSDLRDLRRLVYPVLGRAARTIVLDVENGAVMVRWLSGGRRAVGVTVAQDAVRTAESRFAELGRKLDGVRA